MADRYWRGGTGTWDASSTANWASASTAATFTASRSTTTLTVTAVASGTIAVGQTVWHTNGTSIGKITALGTGTGGTGTYTMDTSGTVTSRTMSSAETGASVPTSSDNVILDADSNVGTANSTITLGAAANCLDFTASGLDATVTLAFSTYTLNLYGNWSNPASNFATSSGTGGTLVFAATSSKTITTNGVTLNAVTNFNGAGGTWTLQDALTCGANRNCLLISGTLDLNNKTLTVNLINIGGSTTRVLAFGSGKVVVTGNSVIGITGGNGSNLTLSGTPVFEFTGSGAVGSNLGQNTQGLWTESNALDFVAGAPSGSAGIYINGAPSSVSPAGYIKNLNLTGLTTALSNSALASLRVIYGSMTLPSTITVQTQSITTTFASTSTGKTVTTNGVTFDGDIAFNGAGGGWTLQDALTLATSKALTLTAGALDLNSKTVTAGSFASSNSNTRTLTATGASFVLAGSGTAWNTATTTNLTLSASGSTITLNSASAKTFAGGNLTYGTLVQGGAGDLTVSGSNTFEDISNTTQPVSVLFTAGTTSTFTAFSLTGTAGNLVTIGSATSATHTLSKASGTVSVNYCSISYSIAAGGATWDAKVSRGNADGGNNTGWIFIVAYTLAAAQGIYGLSGQGLAPLASHQLLSSVGAVTITGQTVMPRHAANNAPDAGSFNLAGNSVYIRAGRRVASNYGDVTLTGQDAAIKTARHIAASHGALALSGQAVGLLSNRTLPLVKGAVVLTGQPVTLTYTPAAAVLVINLVNYATAGVDALLVAEHRISAGEGVITTAGQVAAFDVAHKIVPAHGSMVLAGQSAVLSRGRVLNAAYGGITATGQSAALQSARRLALAYGSLSMTGSAVALRHAASLILAAGGYTLTGEDINLRAARQIVAAYATYALTGEDVSARSSRIVVLTASLLLRPALAGQIDTSAALDADTIIRTALTGEADVRPAMDGTTRLAPALAGTLNTGS